MAKVGAIISILAAAMLAACTSYEEPRTSAARSGEITRDMGYTPGTGVVQSVIAVPGTAVAGGSATAAAPSGDVRLAIKMDNGKLQYVDTASRDFAPGQRVRLTEDRVIMREPQR